jgi:hypothetical protein
MKSRIRRQVFTIPEATHPYREGIVANASNAIRGLPGDVVAQVTITPPPHSQEAKNYWHGVVVKTIHEQCEAFDGSSPAEVHEFLLGQYFGWRTVTVCGISRTYPTRTTSKDEDRNDVRLSPDEMGSLIEWTVAWAAALRPPVFVPDPVKPYR